MGGSGPELCLSDQASSPLTASEASSEVGIGELINFQDDCDNQLLNAVGNYSKNKNNAKQTKRVSRILKNVDKDLAKIKERESSRSISPERSRSSNVANDTSTVSLSLSSSPSPTVGSNGEEFNFSPGSYLEHKTNVNLIHGRTRDNPWCSKNGLFCIVSIILAVIIICLIAYHFDHSKIFQSHSHGHHGGENLPRDDIENEQAKSHFNHNVSDIEKGE